MKVSFCVTLGFAPSWDYKPNINFISEDFIDTLPIDKKSMKFVCTDGSILDGVREPTLFSFGLEKPGFNFF